MKKIFIYFMFFILKNYSFCFQLNCFDSFKSLYHQSPESDALVYAIQKSILKLNFLSVFLSTSFFCTIIFFLLKNQSEKILNKEVHSQLNQFIQKLNRLEESVNNHQGENEKCEEYKTKLANLIKNIQIVVPENIELRNFLEKLTKSIGKSNNEDTEKQIFSLKEDIKKVREHINQLDQTMRLHEKMNIAPNPVNIQYCEEVNKFTYEHSRCYYFYNKPTSPLYLNDFGLERAMNNIIKQNNTSKEELLSMHKIFEGINKIKGEELKSKFDRAFDDAQEWIEGKKKLLDYGNMLNDDNKYKLLFKIFLCNKSIAELNGWKKMIPSLIYNLALYNDDMAYQLKLFFEGGKTINDLENWETLFYFLKYTIDRSNLTNDFLKDIIFKEENYVNIKFKKTLLNHFFLKMFNNHSQINNYQNDGHHKGFRENENYTIDNKLMNKLNFMSCKPFDNFELNDFSHSFNILLETADQQTFTARPYPAMILSKFDNNRKKNLFKQNNGFWAPANLLFNKNFSDLNQEQKEYFHNYLSFLNQSSNFFDSEDNDFKKFRERILITFGNSDNVGKDNEYPNWENINSINNQLLKNYKDSFLDTIAKADIQLGGHFGKRLKCDFLKRCDGVSRDDLETFKRKLDSGQWSKEFASYLYMDNGMKKPCTNINEVRSLFLRFSDIELTQKWFIPDSIRKLVEDTEEYSIKEEDMTQDKKISTIVSTIKALSFYKKQYDDSLDQNKDSIAYFMRLRNFLTDRTDMLNEKKNMVNQEEALKKNIQGFEEYIDKTEKDIKNKKCRGEISYKDKTDIPCTILTFSLEKALACEIDKILQMQEDYELNKIFKEINEEEINEEEINEEEMLTTLYQDLLLLKKSTVDFIKKKLNMNYIKSVVELKNALKIYKSSFRSLEKKANYTFYGSPGSGKTTFALNIIWDFIDEIKNQKLKDFFIEETEICLMPIGLYLSESNPASLLKDINKFESSNKLVKIMIADEADQLMKNRNDHQSGDNFTNMMLNIIDKDQSSKIFTTNLSKENIDTAFIRQGRTQSISFPDQDQAVILDFLGDQEKRLNDELSFFQKGGHQYKTLANKIRIIETINKNLNGITIPHQKETFLKKLNIVNISSAKVAIDQYENTQNLINLHD